MLKTDKMRQQREERLCLYEKLVAMTLHDDQEKFEERPKTKATEKPRCSTALVCLCGPTGDQAHILKLQFLKRMKILVKGTLEHNTVDLVGVSSCFTSAGK